MASRITNTFLFFVWSILAGWRVLTTLFPLPGYLHPDEFFQSSEVIAGEIFDLKVLKTWEFNNKSAPIRSMVFPLLTSGVPFYILRNLAATSFLDMGNFINPYTLLVAPRIVMVAKSLLIDLFIFRICRNFGFPAMPAMLLFSSSYVILTYYQRTLSNAVEAFLLAALLYVVSRHIRKIDGVDEPVSQEGRKKKKEKPKNKVSNGTCGGSCMISLIIVAGTFNRPTFPAFAIVPYVCWLFSDTNFFSNFILILKRMILCLFWGSLATLAFTIGDSVYYGFLDSNLFFEGSSSIIAFVKSGNFLQNLTLTPLNFIRYNMENKNLAEHGVHPRYTHLLANLPMLFGPIATLVLLDILRLPAKASTEEKPIQNRNKILVYLSISIPVILLSIFPHQEPRFLIPLLIPIAIMYGCYLFGSNCYKSLCAIWLLFNFIFFVFYGFLHQGGMYPGIKFLQQKFYNERPLGKINHVIFYHTYMPPWHLFTLNNQGYVGYIQNLPKKPIEQQVFLHDLAGAPQNILEEYIQKLKTPDMSKTEILVVSPSTVDKVFCTWKNRKVFKLYKSFFPHLSMEDPPDYEKDIECQLGSVVLENCNRDCREKSLKDRVTDALGLFIYRVVNLPDDKTEKQEGRKTVKSK